MDLHFKKDAEMLLESQMEVLKGGAAGAAGSCSACCDKENGGVNTQPPLKGLKEQEKNP